MKLSLNGEWKLRYCLEAEHMPAPETWPEISAQVPGNVELDLYRAGVEKEPFYGENLYDYRKYEFYAWRFEREFELETLPESRLMLIFEGLNTYADVYVNGQKVGSADNMLIAHEFDVTAAVQAGVNSLLVEIHSAMNVAREKDYPVFMAANDGSEDYVWQRKPPHSFGWDIMPRFPSAGMWRGVSLESRENTHIDQVYYVTREIGEKSAKIQCRYRIKSDAPMLEGLSARITIGETSVEQKLHFVSGNTWIEIHQPRLWWPRGYGEAALYDAKFELLLNGQVVDVRRERIGIRQIHIDHKLLPGDEGEFLIRVNGCPILAKGSNWVPLDAMHSRDAERYEKALALFYEAGCNIARCWGGNVYEDHKFYDLCDEYGILVWQDFTMACALYSQQAEFQETLTKEATQVVRKLRNHACILLWAGDNEVDESYIGQGFATIANNYNAITRETLPRVVRENDPYRMYLPSSPYIDAGVPRYMVPEQHNWGARAYFKDDFYRNSNAHFISECGYHGCPAPESLKKFIPEDQLWPYTNSAWNTHDTDYLPHGERGYNRNRLMADQVKILFGWEPEDLETFSRLSQIVQAEAKKFFVERTRIKKWRRTGIIWWNMLDGWPQISDAVVDYYFVKKRAFDYIRRVQQKTCVMLDELSDWGHDVILGNDSREAFEVTYQITDGDTGEVLLQGEAHSPANENVKLGNLRILAGEKRLLLITWTAGGETYHNHYITGYPAFDAETMLKWAEKIDRMENRA